MVERVSVHGLQVARVLHDFISQEALPGSGVDADKFWAGFAALGAYRVTSLCHGRIHTARVVALPRAGGVRKEDAERTR